MRISFNHLYKLMNKHHLMLNKSLARMNLFPYLNELLLTGASFFHPEIASNYTEWHSVYVFQHKFLSVKRECISPFAKLIYTLKEANEG